MTTKPKAHVDAKINHDELSDADFQRLVNNQTSDELAVWSICQKMFRSQLDARRQHQVETCVPRWTWRFTTADNKMWNALPPQYQAVLQSGMMLTPDAIVKATGRITASAYFKRVPFGIVMLGD